MDFPLETEWEDESPAGASRGDRENVPPGDHEFRIRQVIEDASRLEIRLEHDDRRYGWVFFRIDKRKPLPFQKKLVAQLAAALALSPEQWNATDAGDLAGRRLAATVQHRTSDSGRVFVNVWGFAPAGQPEQTPAPKPAARTPHQKAKAAAADAGEGEDLIPF
jgi:hypothetical protein